jgi:predicted DNA-binding protein
MRRKCGTLVVTLNLETMNRLERLAQQSGRSVGYHASRAIYEFLDDLDDYSAGIAALKRNESRISLEQLERELGS